jgi:hypothetical protein
MGSYSIMVVRNVRNVEILVRFKIASRGIIAVIKIALLAAKRPEV